MCLARWSYLRHVCGRAMFARKMVTLSIPLPRLCWCCVLCAIFGAFLLIYAKLWHFSIAFSLVLQDLLLLLLQLRLLCLASFRLHMPRFASSSPRVRLVRRMFVQMCPFYTISTHLRNFAFKCATHCHVYCCCSCSTLLLVYAQPLLSLSSSLSLG